MMIILLFMFIGIAGGIEQGILPARGAIMLCLICFSLFVRELVKCRKLEKEGYFDNEPEDLID